MTIPHIATFDPSTALSRSIQGREICRYHRFKHLVAGRKRLSEIQSIPHKVQYLCVLVSKRVKCTQYHPMETFVPAFPEKLTTPIT